MLKRLRSDLQLLTHPVVGAVGFGFLIWMLLPKMVVVIDDDFGYLRSVVETIQRGRPWTYEWLTPWAASMSVLASLLFKLSGSFSFAIHFSLALAAALVFFGFTLFLTDSGVSRMNAWLAAFLLLCSPTVLFMEAMFTAVPLYLGCLWMCVYFSRQGRWGWFFVAWFIGLAARQSAVVWLALPAWTILTHLWQTRSLSLRDKNIVAPVAVLVGAGMAFLLLKKGMNPTYGQALLTTSVKGLKLHGSSLWLSLLALAAGYGWSCFSMLFFSEKARVAAVGNLRSVWTLLAIVPFCAAGFEGAQWLLNHITVTHSSYGDPLASPWFAVIGISAGLGIALRPVWPRWEMLIAGLGATALLGLYGGHFDYYFIDPFFWGFASALMPVSGSDTGHARLPSRLLRWASVLVMVSFCLWNARCYVRLKYEMDRVAALNMVYEEAIRSGKIKPHEIGLAPFGYVGWRFEPYYHSHTPKESLELGGFLNCVDGWTGTEGMAVITELPKPLSPYRTWLPTHNSAPLGKSRDAVTLGKVRSRILWSSKANFILKRFRAPVPRDGKLKINYAHYVDYPFPLNDQEWRMLIKEGKLGE